MSRYILTDRNILYDSNYLNIPYFPDEISRDNYVENYLLADWKNRLNERPDLGRKIETPLSFSFEGKFNFEDIMNKNYLIIEKDRKYYFYFIEGIQNINNNKFILSLTKDLNMTYPALFDKIKNIKATRTHLNNYYGYTFDGGYKEPINISNFPYKIDNEVYNQLKNKGWLVVFERVNTEADYLIKISKGSDYKEPYKIYIAPLREVSVSDNTGQIGEKILYEQSSPSYFKIIERQTPTKIKIQLNDEITLEKDLNIYVNFRSINNIEGNYNYYQNNFIIKKEWLPLELNEEKFIIVPFAQVNNGEAENINKDIKNNGIYNEIVNFISSSAHSTYTTTNLNYLPLKITKLDNLTLEIKLALFSETLEYIPKSGYLLGNNFYYWSSSCPTGCIDLYGVYYPYPPDGEEDGFTIYKISEILYNVWKSDNLFDYLENPENANIISAKTTNFIPIQTNQTTGLLNLEDVINLKHIEDTDIYQITSLDYDFLLEINEYSLDVNDFTKYDLIEGINKYSLIIENQKEFSINPNFITDNKTIDFHHYASFTPNWEERLKYINSKYISLTNENNAFTNTKEFIKGTDQLAQYKVNNPVNSKFEWFKPLANPFNSFKIFKTPKLTIGGKIGNTFNSPYGEAIDVNPIRGTIPRLKIPFPRIAPIFQEIGIGLNRRNLKKSPDEFQGNGDINGDLIFNENGINFSLLEYEFITPERDSIIEDIKRYGVETIIYLISLKDLKQKSFNFFLLDDLDNSDNNDLKNLLSNEEYEELNNIVQQGFRIWWDIEKFLDYSSND